MDTFQTKQGREQRYFVQQYNSAWVVLDRYSGLFIGGVTFHSKEAALEGLEVYRKTTAGAG